MSTVNLAKAKGAKWKPAVIQKFEEDVGLAPNSRLPSFTDKAYHAAIPSLIEQPVATTLTKHGFKLNNGAGADFPELELEVKTRSIRAKSALTIGSMCLDAIVSTNWEHSLIRRKAVLQYRVTYDLQRYTIVNAKVYDFSGPVCQARLKEDYEYARSQLIQNPGLEYTSVVEPGGLSHMAYFEKVSTTYQLRMSAKNMKRFEGIALQEMMSSRTSDHLLFG